MPEISASKFLVNAGWADVPHLSETTKKQLYDETPPYMRDARVFGTPGMGAGAIYPVPLEEVLVKPFDLPDYWPRCYGLDVGWNKTAAIWGAWDRNNDCWYLYTEHYRGKAEPSIHAAAIMARGERIPGVIDPAARGRMQSDGEKLVETYRELGLNLTPYKNPVDAGLHVCWERLSTGRLKVFKTLQNFQLEYRLYRRDEDGAIVKEHDHLMDAMRGLMMSGAERAITKPFQKGSNFIGSAAGGDRRAGI